FMGESSQLQKLGQSSTTANDEQIRGPVDRGAGNGGGLDTWMMCHHRVRGKADPFTEGINLEELIDNYDHICQMAGNSLHIAIGSDLDGMFGKEQSPYDLETIADLQSLQHLLSKRGYTEKDIQNVFHGNWLRVIRKAWS